MRVLFYGIIVLSLSLFAHFIIWKINLPRKNHTLILLKIFFGFFFLSIFISKITQNTHFFEVFYLQKFPEYLQFFLLYSSLTLAYIVSYSAIEVDSPSLTILLNIAKATPDGIDEEKLYGLMTDDLLVKTRIRDLFEDKMICIDKDKYKLTSKAIILVGIFIFFRKLLNAPKGG